MGDRNTNIWATFCFPGHVSRAPDQKWNIRNLNQHLLLLDAGVTGGSLAYCTTVLAQSEFIRILCLPSLGHLVEEQVGKACECFFSPSVILLPSVDCCSWTSRRVVVHRVKNPVVSSATGTDLHVGRGCANY